MWTLEKTWAVGNLLGSDDMNAYVRDNLDWCRSTIRRDGIFKDCQVWGNGAATVWSDFGGTNFVQITSVKRQADSDLRFNFYGSCYTNLANTLFNLGAYQAGIDYPITPGQIAITLATNHTTYAASLVISGLAAATYTWTMRHKGMAGATISTDTNDGVGMEIWESSTQ